MKRFKLSFIHREEGKNLTSEINAIILKVVAYGRKI